MGKCLKKFQTHSQYNSFISGDYKKPNVSYCFDAKEVHYNPLVSANNNITAIYTVSNASEPTQIYFYNSNMPLTGVNIFDKVVIDGTEVSVADIDADGGTYQLSVGEHTVVYTPKDPTKIGISCSVEGCVGLGACFSDCNTLTGIMLPDTLTEIYSAFYLCSFTTITIPASVTKISEYAFENCPVTTITFEDTTNLTIENEAFYDCCSLDNDTYNTINAINNNAFGGCTN